MGVEICPSDAARPWHPLLLELKAAHALAMRHQQPVLSLLISNENLKKDSPPGLRSAPVLESYIRAGVPPKSLLEKDFPRHRSKLLIPPAATGS